MKQQIPKLVTVVRRDLPLGYQAVQSTHAAINFIFEHPDRASPWYYNSNTIAQLSCKDENELEDLIQKCEQNNLAHTIFIEPDIGNEITSIAIEPSDITRKITSRFPLLFKNKI